ncbi:hypothetical protein BH09ACT8_BH09ACT8_48470 [soil metagenome]
MSLFNLLTAVAGAGARTGIEVREVFVKDVIVRNEIRSAAVELVTAKARRCGHWPMPAGCRTHTRRWLP